MTNIGRLKQLYERFSPHINKNCPLNYIRGTSDRDFLIGTLSFTSYLSTNLIYYPFKQSRRSLYVSSTTAESLCPTSFQCTYTGRAVFDRSVAVSSYKNAIQVSGAYKYCWVVKKQYI